MSSSVGSTGGTAPSIGRDSLAVANLTIAALAGLLLVVWAFVPRSPFAGMASYLPFHMFAETFSIVVSMMIFGVMWNAESSERSSGLVMLSCAMLAAGLVDFGHMLSVSGMPRFVTASSPDKGITFWLSARMIAAVGLLVAALRLERPVERPRSRHVLLGISLAATALIYWVGLFHLDALPRFFVEGAGLTPVKMSAEYLVTAILVVPAIMFYRRARRSRSAMHVGLYAAAAISLLSELYFAIYAARHDLFQVLGHAYKVVAYLFVYRAVFLQSVHEPFEMLLREITERRRAEDEVIDRKQAEEALRKANERLEGADRRKNEFMAVLSHELRNPLAPIMNSLYVLERTAPGGDQARRAQAVIHRQVRQLARLVDDLLDITRISRDKIELHRQWLDLSELVRRTVEDHRFVFEKNGVRLEAELPAGGVFVNADWERLGQVVGNLLQNAAKFTAQGGSVRVSAAADTATRRAVVRVADSGVGMQPKMVAQLFQPFIQADQSLDRSKGGLGLGLALVKGLVELHGGEVIAHSDGLGKGAEFTVRLPLDEAATVRTSPVPAVVARRRRVLIVEDNHDAAQSLREALECGEHSVEIARNGPEALAKAREFHPEVVLCDIGLPGMDGYDVARAFRAEETMKGTVLVALSGYALGEDVQRATEAGFDHHFAKPANLEKLERVLAGVTNASPSR